MFKVIVAAVLGVAVLGFWASPDLCAQDMAINGNFELDAMGPWTISGSNYNVGIGYFDVQGTGVASPCYRREPGTDVGNGSFLQDVLLVGGVTYLLEAHVCYYTC
jgi:hypothetical protein